MASSDKDKDKIRLFAALGLNKINTGRTSEKIANAKHGEITIKALHEGKVSI